MALFGARARGGLRRRVQRGLSQQATWQIQVHGKWVCPFCSTQAVKVPEEDERLVELVIDHLDDGCKHFNNGEGQERPLVNLRRFAAYRELRRKVKNQLVRNPSWQLIDVARRWFCPFCGDGTGITIPGNKKMTEEVLQTIIDHVEACYAYDRGKGQEKPFAHLKAIVRYVNQSRKLTENVRRKLEGDPAWRRKDPRSRWICPYCLEAQEHIDLSSNLLMFENAPGQIAKHLAAACEEFKSGAQPKPLETPTRASQLEAIPQTNPKLPAVDPSVLDDDDDDVFRERVEPPTHERVTQLLDEPRDRGGTSLWGRDGIRANMSQPAVGTTLRKLESSGEFFLIDDPEVRSITGRPGPKAVDEWRREIERELATVNMALPALGGDVGSSDMAGALPGAVAVEGLELEQFGLELGQLILAANPPQGGFAEVLDLGQRRIALLAGGVTGEESEAALIAAMAKNLLQHYGSPDVCPSEVLQQVNAEIFADLDGRSFVAVTYALVDLPTSRVRMARAGLAAPVLLNAARDGGLPQPLDSEGMVMGIDKGPIFNNTLEVRTLEMVPGDLLVLFTNGVLEARGGNREEFGLERMHRMIDRYGRHEVAYFLDKFQEYFDLHLRNPMRRSNDACVVALRRLGS